MDEEPFDRARRLRPVAKTADTVGGRRKPHVSYRDDRRKRSYRHLSRAAAGFRGIRGGFRQPRQRLASVRHLVDALRGQVRHFLHTGTIWVHGPSVEVPTTEIQPRRPFGEYGIGKAQIEAYLIEMARKESFPATIFHPGHIVGPGWEPLNPAGHFNPRIFTMLAKGEELALPNFGLETVHHVHADDVAQMFMCAIAHWSGSVGGFFMRFPRPQSRFAAMPRQWLPGSAASRSCAICLGWHGRTGKMNWRQPRLTIT